MRNNDIREEIDTLKAEVRRSASRREQNLIRRASKESKGELTEDVKREIVLHATNTRDEAERENALNTAERIGRSRSIVITSLNIEPVSRHIAPRGAILLKSSGRGNRRSSRVKFVVEELKTAERARGRIPVLCGTESNLSVGVLGGGVHIIKELTVEGDLNTSERVTVIGNSSVGAEVVNNADRSRVNKTTSIRKQELDLLIATVRSRGTSSRATVPARLRLDPDSPTLSQDRRASEATNCGSGRDNLFERELSTRLIEGGRHYA
jgi:hypothetical protein